ncbi:hypothetical protein ACF08N_20025 [Streptomyces sp. NPDC015127]|uniref:hypothetical protein n=1 Tax=Streptomyces sp. NPDC015127 TaxID=3364939 RepID=UPI0036F6BC6A
MSIGRTAAKILVGGAAVLALSGAGQAYAGAGENLDSSVYGASAWSHGTNGQVAVKDTARDSHSVYTLYDRRYNTGLRLDNSKGYSYTVYSGMDEINYVRKVTACVNVQLSPDRCGPDDRPGDGI